MARLLAHWITIAAFLGGAARIGPGAHVNSPAALAVAALVLGLVNAVVRPPLVVLTFSITIPTLGLFYLVTGFALALAAFLVPGFLVDGCLPKILGALGPFLRQRR